MGIQRVNSESHYSKSSKHIDDDVTPDSLRKKPKLIDPDNALDTDNDFESAVSYIEGEMAENSINHYDSWITLNDSDSYIAIPKSSSKTLLPPEMFGVGANKNVNLFNKIFNEKYLCCK